MKGLIGYTVLFMPIFLQCINGMKNLLIGKGKLINPLYDSEEKRKYLLFRAIVELVICAVFMAILFLVLGYNRFAENAINPFIILFFIIINTIFLFRWWLDFSRKKQKALKEGYVLLFFSCFILLIVFLALC